MTDPVSSKPANENDHEPGASPQLPDYEAQVAALHQSMVRGPFEEATRVAGGPVMWFRSQCPRAAAEVSGTLSDTAWTDLVLSESMGFWIGHEARLRDCAHCEEGEAVCFDTADKVPAGQKIRLNVIDGKAKELWQPCRRYAEFKLAKRLQDSGVDRLLSTQKLSSLGELPPEVDKAFVGFLETGAKKKRSPKEYSLLIESRKCRSLGVALLRNSIKNFPHAAYKSVHAPSLEREFKNALTTKEKSPLEELLTFDVLLIDEVNGDLLKSKFRKELTWLYERRRDQGLATIITTTVPAKEAFPGVSVLRV